MTGAHSLSEQLLAALDRCLRRRNPLVFLFLCKDVLESSAVLLNRSSGYSPVCFCGNVAGTQAPKDLKCSSFSATLWISALFSLLFLTTSAMGSEIIWKRIETMWKTRPKRLEFGLRVIGMITENNQLTPSYESAEQGIWFKIEHSEKQRTFQKWPCLWGALWRKGHHNISSCNLGFNRFLKMDLMLVV